MRLWTLLRKDTKVILRSRLLLATLVIYPLLIVGIIGFAFSQPNTRIPIAILNNDVDDQGNPIRGIIQDPISQNAGGIEVSTTQLIQGDATVFGLADYADLTTVRDEEEGRALLLSGQVQAFIIFPKGFVHALIGFSESATIRVIVDRSDAVRANVTEIMVRGVVQQLQERYVEQKVEFVVNAIDQSLDPRVGDRLYPGFRGSIQRLREIEAKTTDAEDRRKVNETLEFLREAERVLRDSRGIVDSVAQPVRANTEGEQSGHLYVRDLIVPAALGLSIFWTGSLATSSLVVYEREAPAYRRLGITPTRRSTIIGSKVLLTSAIILVQSLFILIAALLAWNTQVDNIPLTILIVMLSTFASIGLGIFLSGISRDVNGTVLLAVLTTFPMLFLSGLFYPVSFMPKGAQVLAGFFPLTYTVEALRGSMLRGFEFIDAIRHILVLALFGIGLILIGSFLGRLAERRT